VQGAHAERFSRLALGNRPTRCRQRPGSRATSAGAAVGHAASASLL